MSDKEVKKEEVQLVNKADIYEHIRFMLLELSELMKTTNESEKTQKAQEKIEKVGNLLENLQAIDTKSQEERREISKELCQKNQLEDIQTQKTVFLTKKFLGIKKWPPKNRTSPQEATLRNK